MSRAKVHALEGGQLLPPLPEAILLVLAPVAPRFSRRVWCHAQLVLLGAMLAPGARTVTAALRAMGLAPERHVTKYHRVLKRATWSARPGSRIRLGVLSTFLVPPGATIVLGADDTVERRRGRQIRAKGGDRDAVRSPQKHVVRCLGLTWGSMRLWVPGPWSQRVWALPLLTVRCWPAKPRGPRRPQPRGDWVRQMMPHMRRWLPGRQVVLVVAGGCAAGSLAGACVKPQVTRGSRWRWDAAREHSPDPQPPGTRGPQPTKGKRQRRWPGWAERSDTPWEDVAVNWDSGQRQQRGGFSRTGLWYTPRLPPVELRYVVVADPAGKRRLEAFFSTDLPATPAQILPGVVRRWAVEVTVAEARAQLGVATQRQWSEQAIARTPPIRFAVFSLVTVLALRLSHDGQIPVPVTAWYHTPEPTCADGLALVQRYLGRARYVVHSPPEAASRPFPQGALDL